jgi:hypothetical protein
MKTIISKNVLVSDGDVTITHYPGVFSISVKQNQIQIDNKHLDSLIKLLQVFKEQREMEHTLKDIIVNDDKENKL